MARGFESYVMLENTLILATGASAPKSRQKLDSQSAYFGAIGSTGGMGNPHEYDYNSYDGSFDAELTPDIFDNHLKAWIISGRKNSKQISMQTRKSGSGSTGMQRLPECYWENISFDANQGNAITSSVGFISWEKDISSGSTEYNAVTDLFIQNKAGLISDLSLLSAIQVGGVIPALNSSSNNAPIPWWRASLSSAFTGTSSTVAPIGWSLSFSQALEKITLCKGVSTVAKPTILAVGVLTGELNVEMMILEGSYNISTNLGSISVAMGASSFGLGNIQLGDFSDDVKGGNDSQTISLKYDIYGPLS